jgi:hypothetical protein
MNLANTGIFVIFVSLVVGLVAAKEDNIVEKPTPKNICQGINLGIFADPFSCQSYIVCIFGNADLYFCDPSTPVFDSERLVCVAGNLLKLQSFEKVIKFYFHILKQVILIRVKYLFQRK